MIQAVVFDFGGVLTQGEASHSRLQEFDDLLGWPGGTLRLRLFAGEAWELASTGAISPEEHWDRVGADLESRLPPDFRCFRSDPFAHEQINRDAVELVRRLSDECRLALCSNALPGLADYLQQSQLAALFDVIVISALVGLRKPDPRIYHVTAGRLGLPLDACLLVDDKERNVLAAQAAGMPAVVFESAAGLEASLPALLQNGGCP